MIGADLQSKKGFYVGDICYVLDDPIYDGVWGKADYEDGVYETEFGKFAVASTAYGDGEYYDQFGHRYGVDAGVIGMVPWEILEQQKKWKRYSGTTDEDKLNGLGHFFHGTEARFMATGRNSDGEDGLFDINLDTEEQIIEIQTDDDYWPDPCEDDDDYDYDHDWIAGDDDIDE